MTLPSGLGMPDDDEAWLVREVRQLRAEVAELRASLGQDGVTISRDGAMRVKGTDGLVDVFFAGTYRDDPHLNNPVNGDRQRGVELRRDDGSIALGLGEYAADNGTPFKQALALYDAAGRVIVAEDADGGKGLAAPYLSGGLCLTDTNVATYPQTTGVDENGAATWTSIVTGQYVAMNPRVRWSFLTLVDAGATAQLRLSVGDLVVTYDVPAGFTYWQDVAALVNWTPSDVLFVNVEGRITQGASADRKVYASPKLFVGAGS